MDVKITLYRQNLILDYGMSEDLRWNLSWTPSTRCAIDFLRRAKGINDEDGLQIIKQNLRGCNDNSKTLWFRVSIDNPEYDVESTKLQQSAFNPKLWGEFFSVEIVNIHPREIAALYFDDPQEIVKWRNRLSI